MYKSRVNRVYESSYQNETNQMKRFSICYCWWALLLVALSQAMSVRPILKMGDPRLLRQAKKVESFNTPELHDLLKDLYDTMKASKGTGLAAPQIGIDLQIVVFGTGEPNPRYPEAQVIPTTTLINPVITEIGSEQQFGYEGCLSVPGLRGEVPRHMQIRYQGFDEFGNTLDKTVEGLHSRLVQHECDHLLGKLYPMRIVDFGKFGFSQVSNKK